MTHPSRGQTRLALRLQAKLNPRRSLEAIVDDNSTPGFGRVKTVPWEVASESQEAQRNR
jgi:hypothetical protein